MMYNKNIILDFISEFSDGKEIFLNGKCYWFARILKDRFDDKSEIMYNQVDNHFCCKIDGVLYDASGIIENEDGFISWRKYKNEESSDTIRLFRDCIMYDKNIENKMGSFTSEYYIACRNF